MTPPPLAAWHVPVYPRLLLPPHITGGRYRAPAYTFVCIARLGPSRDRMSNPVEALYAPDEPFSIVPREFFDLHAPDLRPLEHNVFRWRDKRCHWYRLRVEFEVAIPEGTKQVKSLRVAVPEADPHPIRRPIFGSDALEPNRVEIGVRHGNSWELSQQYISGDLAGRCGHLVLPPAPG